MKKLLLIFFISISLGLFAQTSVYHPFPDSNAVWLYDKLECLDPNANPPCLNQDYKAYYYVQKGDTVVNAIPYHKLYMVDSTYATPWYLFGGIREDSSRKIYFNDFANTSFTEQLLYDFSSRNIGDTIVHGYYFYCKGVINSIDSFQLATGEWRSRYWVNSCAWPLSGSFVIEGIGSNNELIQGALGWEYRKYDFLCYHQNDTLYYYDVSPGSCTPTYPHFGVTDVENTPFFSISPNPSSGSFKINASLKMEYSICDILGRSVEQGEIVARQSTALDFSSQPKGIYFVRGKSEDKVFSRKIVLQ